MNRLGMMVDISHVADKTFYRTLVITRAPVIASHSAARALCDAPRNMTDDMLRAVAINGGVVQVNFYSGFISQAYRDASKAQQPEVEKAIQDFKDKAKAEGKQVTYADLEKIQRSYADKIPRPPLSALIDQIDHIAKVAGVDHTGLGLRLRRRLRPATRRHRLRRRPAQDHRGTDGPRLLRRRLRQDSRRESAAGFSRSRESKQGVTGREPAQDHREAAVR